MNAPLRIALSDILNFQGNIGSSKSGSLRLEEVSDKEFILSIALPKEDSPTVFLLSATCVVFLTVLAPSYPKIQTLLQESADHFGSGFSDIIREKFSKGVIEVSYQKESFVYEVRVKIG